MRDRYNRLYRTDRPVPGSFTVRLGDLDHVIPVTGVTAHGAPDGWTWVRFDRDAVDALYEAARVGQPGPGSNEAAAVLSRR